MGCDEFWVVSRCARERHGLRGLRAQALCTARPDRSEELDRTICPQAEKFAVSTQISPREFPGNALLETAVFALDRWLRRRRGVFEYSLDPQCLFRLERRRADDTLVLADGTVVCAGAPVLVLHLWNEHVPLMGRSGPTLAWAHKTSRGIDASLEELAHFLGSRPDLSPVRVLYADVRVSGASQAVRAARMMARYGFETTSASVDRRPAPQRMADALFVLLMAGVTNPCSLRSAPMRHANLRVFMSRTVLERRYDGCRAVPLRSAGRPAIDTPGAGRLLTSARSEPVTENE